MTPVQRAQLALLLEVAGTPKPGNVDRQREYAVLRFEHFLAGAVGSTPGLRLAANPAFGLGLAFETAVRGMSRQEGGNTQFGALLLLVPLVRATVTGPLHPTTVRDVVTETTVGDAVAFYRAFDHVDVAVGDPPAGLEDLDIRAGARARQAVLDHGLSWYGIMQASAEVDGVAREWTTGFERTFDAADRLYAREGSVLDREAGVFLELLAEEPDTFVEKQHDAATAAWATEQARRVRDGDRDVDGLAEEFVTKEINPGTTADLIAGGVYVALARGLVV